MHTYYQNNFSIYFEVGNEENYHGTLYGLNNYQYVFGIVAQALQSKLNSYGFTNYHILTSGMLNPTAYFNSTGSCTAPGNDVNVADASNAIIKAENDYGVSAARLGVAVHPYHYNTNESGYWQNYYTQYRGTSGTNGYAGACGDLLGMYQLWEGLFSGMPLVFTEDNWSDHPADHINGCTGTSCNPTCSDSSGCEGAYLVDLFTWLTDHGVSESNSNVRVLVYRGADKDVTLGIYQINGNEKTVNIPNCLYNAVNGTHTLSNDYYYLRTGACY